jgi:chromosome segregation protein
VRIKKIEITGFKSFCDRTILTFDQPITAIVGPNGCGKSNVVDAMRWCMGEQSAKHLRGKEMQDVIFAGSDSRGPMGMAEVSLTFENDGRVPLEYMSYAEITVTRRLFRDGTSEYLLNKVPVRLRDVVDLFLGTGVGTKAYSIIEQGRIGLIVSSKAEDRRLLIEEAAGITKYKTKKKAAERKMEATRQNLTRVSDILGEIGERLGALRRQAQKAERYKRYKAEMRDIELWSASHRWLGFVAQAKIAAAAADELSTRAQAEASELGERELAIETARVDAMEEERRLGALQERLYAVDGRVRLCESEMEFQSREADQLEASGHAQRGEIEELGRRHAEIAAERTAAEAGLCELDRAAAELAAQLSAAEDAYRAARAELLQVQAEVDGHKQAIARAETEMARADEAARSLERRAADLATRIDRIQAEEALSHGRIEEHGQLARALGKRLGSLRQTKLELGSQREEHEARLEQLKSEVARSEIELETLRTELHRRRSRHASLEEIQERYEGFQRGVRAIMQSEQRAPGVRGLVADIVQAPAEYEAAVEAVLGEKLGSIVVESCEVGVEAIDYLKQRSEGRGTFIPVDLAATRAPVPATDSVPPGARPLLELVGYDRNYDRVATYLFGDTVVVEDLQHALDLWRGGARSTFVTREGEIVDPHGIVTGGSRDGGAGVLGQKRELRELEEIIARLESDYQEVLQRHVTTKAEITALGRTLEAVQKDSHQGEIEILSSEKDLGRSQGELERLRARAESLSQERVELEAARVAALAQMEEERQRLLAAAAAHDGATRALLGLKEQAEGLLARVDNAATQTTDLKVRAAQAREQQAAAHKQATRLGELDAELGERTARLERAIADGQARATVLREAVARAQDERAQLAEESRALAEQLRTGRAAYEERLGALAQAEAAWKSLRQQHDATTEALHAERAHLSDLERERVHVEETMMERYQAELARHVGDYHLRAPVGEADDARLRELRGLIERMGEINLMAIEECAELEKRFEFLSTQKGDLELALDQLEKAIARINRASKARFQETFEAVNAKFQEVFPRLFRGGQAHLALTAAEDVLEAGVEIIAQPPGKKLQGVELLSGGEKALTAVALIFAIFLIKPSPFCLLDEVDAPLDEANVIRYNELVSEMTDRSQFIVITHNKRTMEIADQLYGVTMEEAGISKIVSVNLSKSGEKRAA